MVVAFNVIQYNPYTPYNIVANTWVFTLNCSSIAKVVKYIIKIYKLQKEK